MGLFPGSTVYRLTISINLISIVEEFIIKPHNLLYCASELTRFVKQLVRMATVYNQKETKNIARTDYSLSFSLSFLNLLISPFSFLSRDESHLLLDFSPSNGLKYQKKKN